MLVTLIEDCEGGHEVLSRVSEQVYEGSEGGSTKGWSVL